MGTKDFDPGPGLYTLVCSGGLDIYIHKLNSNGDFVWAKRLGGPGYDHGLSFCLDNYGNVYATGTYHGTADFDPGFGVFNLTSAGSDDIFVCKLSSAGDFVWARSMGGANEDLGHAISIDAQNNVYVSGYYKGTSNFSQAPNIYTISSDGDLDAFVCKLNNSGDLIWARTFGGTGEENGREITVDSQGNSYITGYFNDTVYFNIDTDSSFINSHGSSDIFITKLNSYGTIDWVKGIGGAEWDKAEAITVDLLGNVYVTGYFQDTVDFDPDIGAKDLISYGLENMFVLKLENILLSNPDQENNSSNSVNVFTPNNDGINDFFILNLPEGEVINIYNRWGVEIISLKTEIISNNGWDGRTSAGIECSAGVYFYTSNHSQHVKGFVQLLR
jgi:gliding motility-associated-like protein